MVLDTLLLENNNVPGSQMTAEQFTAGAAGIYKAEINIQAETTAGAERRVWLKMSGATLEYSQMRARYIYLQPNSSIGLTLQECFLGLSTPNTPTKN